MINFKEFDNSVAYGSRIYDRGFCINCGIEPIILKGSYWEHDLSQEDFSNYDYVELNGVRFNKA